MLDYGMNPQAALDAPRFCIGPGRPTSDSVVMVEEGIPTETISQLKTLGHSVQGPVMGYNRTVFGRGQIIQQLLKKSKGRNSDGEIVRVWSSGSDGRGDGMALGY